MVIGNYMEKRCKIININTGKEREVITVPCKICDRNFDPKEEGICGVIGEQPVLFCTICMTGLVDMVEFLKEQKKEKDETNKEIWSNL